MESGSQEQKLNSKEPLHVLLLGEGRHTSSRAPAVAAAAGAKEELAADTYRAFGEVLLRNLERAAASDVGPVEDSPIEVVDASEAQTGDDVVRDLLTGHCFANSVLLVVPADRSMLQWDIREGGRLREHLFLASTLGFRRVVVCVDGMSDPSQMCAEHRLQEVRGQLWDLLENAGFKAGDITFLPAVDLADTTSKELLPAWHSGPSLLDALRDARTKTDLSGRALRVPLQEVYMVRGVERVAVGRVETGTLKEGMQLSVAPSGLPVNLRLMEGGNCTSPEEPFIEKHPGEEVRFVGLSLATDQGSARLDAEQLVPGTVLSEASRDPAQACRSFLAEFVVLRDPPRGAIRAGYQPTLDVHSAHVQCLLKELTWRRPRQGPRRVDMAPGTLREGDVAEAWIEPLEPVSLEVFSFCPPLGRFALCDGEFTVAAGVIKDTHSQDRRIASFDD